MEECFTDHASLDGLLRSAEADLRSVYDCSDAIGNPLLLPPVVVPSHLRSHTSGDDIRPEDTLFPLSVVYGVALDTRLALEEMHERAVVAMITARSCLTQCHTTLTTFKPRGPLVAHEVVIRRQLGECFLPSLCCTVRSCISSCPTRCDGCSSPARTSTVYKRHHSHQSICDSVSRHLCRAVHRCRCCCQ